MQNKPYLVSVDVEAIATAAAAEAVAQGWKVSIAIVDDGGHLLHLQRLDGAAPMTADMSHAKARAAAMGCRETKAFEDSVGLLEGGVPVMVEGRCVGAVGVSGVKSSEDAQVARAGIAALVQS